MTAMGRALSWRWCLALWLLLWAQPGAQTPATVTIVHINDVYEIDAVEGGRFGGLARVATVLRRLEQTKPPVLMTLGGDYLSPSAIGTAVVDGQPLAGQQMVDVLNAVGLDWAVLGNHEFDVAESAFRARISESKFGVVASNVSDANGQPFPGTVRSAVVPIRSGSRSIRLGLVGLTFDSNRRPWVRYAPPVDAARAEVAGLRGKVDAIVALTHLPLASDEDLVNAVPEIDLVLGGHEHENWLLRRGPRFTPIVKADANGRSVAVVTLTFANGRPTVDADFHPIDDQVALDRQVQSIVDRWTRVGFEALRRAGFEPRRVVTTIAEPLDGRESTVRMRSDRLTDLITAALDREAGGVDVAIFNAGSVRIDDVIQPGPLSEYDVMRILPFGGKVVRLMLHGSLLRSVLDIGRENIGSGGYLHVHGAARRDDEWLVQGKPLDPDARYRVATTDFLLSGGETNLGFLTAGNPEVNDVQELRDVRLAFIDQLRASK
jgi:5'-nucleotidase